MRKLLSGYLFRLIKSIDKWVLIFLYALASSYLIYTFVSSKSFITMTRGNHTLPWGEHGEITISKDNVKDYKFESLGVSEYNLYRVDSEPIPQEEYDAIFDKCGSIATGEKEILFGLIEFLHVVPAVIVLILIPDFFGSMFKDRTIKNLIACGYSKGKIYLSSLVFSFLLNLAMILTNIIIYILLCIFYMWKPPVYLPVVIVMLLVEILITFTLSSISLAFVFISGKRTVAFIAAFLMIWAVIGVYISKYESGGTLIIDSVYYEVNDYENTDRAAWEDYMYILEHEGSNVFEERFDIFTFRHKTYYKGRELKLTIDGYMPPVKKFAGMAIIYLDPLVVERFESFGLGQYVACRDGIMAMELANNVFWILLSTCAGITFFKRRELPS